MSQNSQSTKVTRRWTLLALLAAGAGLVPAVAGDTPTGGKKETTPKVSAASASAAKTSATTRKPEGAGATSTPKAAATTAKPSGSANASANAVPSTSPKPSGTSTASPMQPAPANGTTAALAQAQLPGATPKSAPPQLETLRQAAVAAYNERSWQAAAEAADAFATTLDGAELPRAGADYALVSFIGGHARFELWKQNPDTFKYDFDRDVLGAMTESLVILQDDPFYKHNVLGTAYYEKVKYDHYRNVAHENAASWHMYKALLARAEELQAKPRDGEEYTAFAKYVLQYIGRCFEMARYSTVPNIYLVRIREACRLGFGTQFDDRFAQLYQVVGFDDGNVRAGVLWQTALDQMNTEGSRPDDVLDTFRQAAEATNGHKYRAEVYRQMSDFSSRQDGHNYKLAAVEYGRLAYKLDPDNPDIQVQYGSSLHVVSYAHYTAGRFHESLAAAQEATSFEWDGNELAYFDLSRSQANFGDRINALISAEKSYDQARKKYQGNELQPYRQNYVNILRQFGLAAKAAQIEHDGQGS